MSASGWQPESKALLALHLDAWHQAGRLESSALLALRPVGVTLSLSLSYAIEWRAAPQSAKCLHRGLPTWAQTQTRWPSSSLALQIWSSHHLCTAEEAEGGRQHMFSLAHKVPNSTPGRNPSP
eukprot:2100789-Amphidinium_carterae.1